MRSTFFRIAAVMGLVGLLSACESADSFSSGGSGGPGSTTETFVSLYASSNQVLSNGTDTVTITAVVKDTNNVALEGQAVSFAATSGDLTNVVFSTDATGTATADLSAGGDPTVRTIVVTATSGTSSDTYSIGVTGTQLSISGATNSSAGTDVTLTIKALTSAGTAIVGAPVTIASAAGNPLSTTAGVTNNSGQLEVTVRADVTDTITASALGMTTTHSLAVSLTPFTLAVPATVQVSTDCQPVTATWSAAPDGSIITFFATRGTLYTASTCVTTADSASTTGGSATLYIKSPTAGPSSITAVASDGTAATASTTFVASVPASIALSADKTTIAPNGTASLTAIVKDASQNLVSGARVTFAISGDTTGATISPGYDTTDDAGRASVAFQASSQSSDADGINVTAKVYNSLGALIAQDTVTLTVGQQGLFIAMGVSNKLTALNSDTTYKVAGSVQILDAGSNAVPNVPVTLQIVPTYYAKGYRQWSGAVWATVETVTVDQPTLANFPRQLLPCVNEQILAGNPANGTIEPGEDYNNNGAIETGFIASVESQVTTDSTGTAVFNIIYAKDFADWTQVQIKASAGVAGADSSETIDLVLPALAGDVQTQTATPPGFTSPFGRNLLLNGVVNTTCANPL